MNFQISRLLNFSQKGWNLIWFFKPILNLPLRFDFKKTPLTESTNYSWINFFNKLYLIWKISFFFLLVLCLVGCSKQHFPRLTSLVSLPHSRATGLQATELETTALEATFCTLRQLNSIFLSFLFFLIFCDGVWMMWVFNWVVMWCAFWRVVWGCCVQNNNLKVKACRRTQQRSEFSRNKRKREEIACSLQQQSWSDSNFLSIHFFFSFFFGKLPFFYNLIKLDYYGK